MARKVASRTNPPEPKANEDKPPKDSVVRASAKKGSARRQSVSTPAPEVSATSKKTAAKKTAGKKTAVKKTARKSSAPGPAVETSAARKTSIKEKPTTTPALRKTLEAGAEPKAPKATARKKVAPRKAAPAPSAAPKPEAPARLSRRAAIEADELALEAQNRRYYDAFQELNITRLGQLWWRDETATCAHPGWDLRYGWPAVRQTYREIFRGTRAIRFSLGNVRVRVVGDLGYVTCIENLVSDERDSGDYLGAVLATNVFERRNKEWRLVHHHASPFSVEELFIPEGPLH